MKIQANGIQIEYEDSHANKPGDTQPVVLLCMGWAMQLTAWPPLFIRGLQNAGFRVIRYDHRDSGLSSHCDAAGEPGLLWASTRFNLGLKSQAPYALQTMADDALGLMQALGIDAFHVLGVSMGGMVAQRMAQSAPHSIKSLTCMMSSSGARSLPGPQASVGRAMVACMYPAKSPAEYLERQITLYKALSSPGFAFDETSWRAGLAASMQRACNPLGAQRQMAAILADASRAKALSGIRTPTLVLHGMDDPMLPYACALDLVQRIPNARLVGLAGWGHDLPAELLPQILQVLLPHLQAPSLQAPSEVVKVAEVAPIGQVVQEVTHP